MRLVNDICQPGVEADHAALTPIPEDLLEFVASLAYVIENLLPFWN